MVSAAVALVFNGFHPRVPGQSLNDLDAVLRVVAASGEWRLVHLVSVAASLVGALAIVAILWSMSLAGPSRWPAVACASLVLTVPVLLLSVATDGFAVKAAADRWAAAGGEEAEHLLAAGAAVRSLDEALLDLVMVTNFGLTTILLGVASWTSRLYGPRLGLVAVVAGVLGVTCGTIQAVLGRLTTFSYLGLLTGSLALFTAWLLVASVVLWRRAGEVAAGLRSRP